MKLIVICALALVGVLASSVQAQDAAKYAAFQKLQESCKTEQAVSAADAKIIENGINLNNTNPSKALKCYYPCLYKKMGAMDATGKVKDPALVQQYLIGYYETNAAKVDQALKTCADIKGDNECDFVYNFEVCIFKAMKA